MLPRNGTGQRHVWRIGLGILLLAASVPGCSSAPAGADTAPPRQVRRELAQRLEQSEHLRLTEFREEGEGRYAAGAKSPDGATYHVTAKVHGREMTYEAEGGGRLLRGWIQLPEPPFEEGHPLAVQWLRGLAFVIQAAGAVWPALGRFGWRRRFSPRTETILLVFGPINAGFAAWWAYQIALNWGAASGP
jgi:hypothetical protein